MKCQNSVRRTGAVLLMILGLMSMFAISILTYMVVTSNMAETAQNSAKIDATVQIPAQADVEAALKTVLIGSNNMRNPIGPFSILENMYGDWKEYSNGSEYLAEFLAYIQIFPNLGVAAISPVEDMYNNLIRNDADPNWSDADARSSMMQLFENSGGVLTFKSYESMPNNVAGNLWSADVEGTSAFVLEKVVTNPTNLLYRDGTDGAYWAEHYDDEIISFNNQSNYFPCDAWHFKIEFTDDLKRFVEDLKENQKNIDPDTPYNINKDFNEQKVQVFVRLNRPAYSGTGAGGFTPGEAKDASMPYQWMVNNRLRTPFAFWTNASAPDFYPFYLDDNSKINDKKDFRSYWAHLTDVNYDSSTLDSVLSDAPDGMRYASDKGNQGWGMGVPVTSGFQEDSYLEPVRMNPAYNAPDSRTLFLAYFGGPMTFDGGLPDFTPSFHRTASFDMMAGYLGTYSDAYGRDGAKKDVTACLTALIRKLTPRPLPLDHWKFDGGNDLLRNGVDASNNTILPLTTDVVAQRLTGKDGSGNPIQWDVDNDGDGVREGIWIPSGLPIRVDKNGTPYATMFSYTIVDLDGRVNVNTAGNWDQLPNNLYGDDDNYRYNYSRPNSNGDNYDDYTQPFNYLDELSGLADGSLFEGKGAISSSSGQPFYNVRNLNAGDFGWRDDYDNDQISVAVRGDGRGTSNVQLYEALSAIFLESFSTFDVNTIASNLLWRRNLSLRNDPLGTVDQSGLKWETNNMMGSQPGDGNSDDSLNTRKNFFALMNPIRLGLTEAESKKNLFSEEADDIASLGEAKMLYPYRGKMTVDMNSVVSSAVYDFANTAFRSYDPLGAQIYTYAPRYSENPYQAYQNVLSWQDSPYTLPMLERLLRPTDVDAVALPSQLVDDLHLNTDTYGDPALERERVAARQSLTTISSDVPSPSLVFPENIQLEDGEYRGGSFGFADLIRKCVRQELFKVFELKGVLGVDIDGNARKPADYLDGNPVFDNKVEEITAYLVSMLPPEIMAGEKIDLNALSQKNYWLDVDYDSNGNPIDSNDVDRTLHNVGLVKRMERARGLYIVLMTLLYEDMNANRLYGDNDNDVAGGGAGAGGAGEDGSEDENNDGPDFQNYFEGSFDLLSFEKPGDDTTKNLMAQQLTATRIAQWCVNMIDFSDPDATMTPFFFDPTPFDGWWVYDDSWIEDTDNIANGGANRWNPDNGWGRDEPTVSFLFDPVNGLPGEQMNTFFRDALDQSERVKEFDSPRSPYLGPFDEVDADGKNLCSNEYIAKWMSKKIKKLEDQTTDLGFRLIWGMERPDLVLTETLSFHDLGIADTNLETTQDNSDPSYVQSDTGGGEDPDFDQVKRPVGSTYLELYCTANPNVPQSRELYDYDSVNGVWKLRLSKKTPIYTSKNGNELEMPIWRVAIGASADPRGLYEPKSLEGVDKASIRNSSKVVYQKRRNSVLEWLTPKKSGNDYIDDFNFFSMQPRQFRNYPTNTKGTEETALEVKNIADLDIDQGVEGEGDNAAVKDPLATNFNDEWKSFNLSSSNILGPAVASEYGSLSAEENLDKNPRTREIELDRIVWFSHALGDDNNGSGLKLGTAGKYPDALRTFANAVDEVVYLEPNQYLVVGPDKKRKIGSVAYNFTITDTGNDKSGKFDTHPTDTSTQNWINIDNSGSNGLSDTHFKRNYVYMVAKSNIGDRGLNISEPLWTAHRVDPYALKVTGINDPVLIDPQLVSQDNEEANRKKVLDVPFELPGEWSEGGSEDTRRDVTEEFYKNTVKNYPIVQDKLFGIGTVPAYKSAFVQRVADPNRPYHPLMNPYITVDWNVMDLTIFTGEGREFASIEDRIKDNFSIDGDYSTEHSNNNGIKLAANVALNLEKDKTLALNDTFSSRQWGNGSQKSFAPTLDSNGFAPSKRPNPWARAYKVEGDNTGLESGEKFDFNTVTEEQSKIISIMDFVPNHTLGMYNDAGKWGNWISEVDADGNPQMVWKDAGTRESGQFKQLNQEYMGNVDGNLRVYNGAPRIPFEHLVWNDAPYSNPMELTMVPASAPGRFGLEFVRQESDCDLSRLYNVDRSKGGALGSYGIFGYKDWYAAIDIKVPDGNGGTKNDDKFSELKKNKPGCMGPYLNFFASSKKAGNTLNLCNLLEFVYVPSLYLGTKKLAGRDDNGNLISDKNGNPLFYSKRREPGKINLNTLTKPAWQAISPNSERVQLESRLPGTSWDDLMDYRKAKQDFDYDRDGNIDNTSTPFCYFQPSHALGLWVQMDGAKAPVPSFSSILAQRECDLSKENSVSNPPIFDNIMPSTDGNGALKYRYSYTDPDDPNKKISGEGVWSEIENLSNQNYDNFEYDEIRSPRNNLYEATAEMQRLSGLTTTRSNTFAVWVTVGYFEVERCDPGVNMPNVDPDGNKFTIKDLTDPNYKWYYYYQAIYPDGYTYGKELGSEFGETQRHRGFSIIDRSIPVDYRRGNSSNWEDAVLIKRVID